MRVGIYTWGSEGDVRPFLALARGLGAAGHEVRVGFVAADGRDYAALAAPYGVDARPVAADEIARARATQTDADEALAGKGHPMRQVQTVLKHLLDPAVEAMWSDAEQSLPGCDLAVVHLLHHPAASLALKHQIPIAAVQPIPMWPTRQLAPMGAPELGPLNPLAWWLADRLSRRWLLPRVNRSRTRAGVAPETSLFPRPNRVKLTLTCVSPTLVPRPRDWDDSQRIPGFFELPARQQNWSPPDSLLAFLQRGLAPVLMGFGSMLTNPTPDTRYCMEVMAEAAILAGCRALIQAPWEHFPDLPTGPDVYRLGRAPHALVLPHCAAFVHHGGAGTTHTACLAGRPSVVVPFLGDQFFWASRLRSMGLAPDPVPRKTLTAARLARQLRALLQAPRMADQARAVGEAMAREDGVGQAVTWLEEAARGM